MEPLSLYSINYSDYHTYCNSRGIHVKDRAGSLPNELSVERYCIFRSGWSFSDITSLVKNFSEDSPLAIDVVWIPGTMPVSEAREFTANRAGEYFQFLTAQDPKRVVIERAKSPLTQRRNMKKDSFDFVSQDGLNLERFVIQRDHLEFYPFTIDNRPLAKNIAPYELLRGVFFDI